MEIKTIEEAKKYLNKTIFTATEINRNTKRYEIKPLYIGYEDEKSREAWGDVKKENIGDKFDAAERSDIRYFFFESEAEKYAERLQKDELEQEKDYDIKTAKELLGKHKIKYEIFN